uniref:Uncharacterized protein n=1 Tax=Arundo donax TaxID=35708 RepID=A0A0A9A8T5_ARUDO
MVNSVCIIAPKEISRRKGGELVDCIYLPSYLPSQLLLFCGSCNGLFCMKNTDFIYEKCLFVQKFHLLMQQ